jgi:hypothetical protein
MEFKFVSEIGGDYIHIHKLAGIDMQGNRMTANVEV